VYCINCAQPLAEGARFCHSCGTDNAPTSESPSTMPSVGRSHTRLRASLFLGAVGIVVAGLVAGLLLRGGSDNPEAQVRNLMDLQLSLARDHNWTALYQTYSPGFRQSCPYDRYTQRLNATGGPAEIDWSKVQQNITGIRVQGDTANTTYVVLYDGRTADTVTASDPDIYVRVNGTWYDEVDSHTHC
jgi:hypothetical protein